MWAGRRVGCCQGTGREVGRRKGGGTHSHTDTYTHPHAHTHMGGRCEGGEGDRNEKKKSEKGAV